MKFLDLFAGIGGFRSGLEKAGHKCVGYVEIDEFARKSYQAIYDTKGEYTEHDIRKIDTTKLPKADIWTFGFPCFTGDTLVQTKAGLKEIKDVLINDEVVTIDGSWQKVLTTMNKISTNVYNLKVQGQVDTKVTGNHPYWVRGKIRTHSGYRYSTPEWLEAEKIKHGDLVQSLRYKETTEIPELSLDTLWLLGRYVADGYLFSQKRKDRPNPTYRTIFSIRTSKVKEFKEKLENFNMTEDKSAGKHVHKFISTDKELYRLSSEFGKLAHNKEIPAYVFNMSKKQQETFLLGYLSGDGDITKNGYTRANSVSKKLIIGLSKLVESVYGCSVSIFYTKRPNKHIIEGREVNQRDTWTLQYSTKTKVKSYNQEQEAQWYPVKEITPIEGTYTVYNLEVQNNNTYNANGVIIHNCQDISVAGKQKGFAGERSSLFFAVTGKLRQLKDEQKPSYLLIENVKNLLSINGGRDFGKLQIELDEIGYDVEWDVLDTAEVLPQHRERVYIVGHFRGRGTRKVFPIARKSESIDTPKQKIIRVFDGRNTGTYGSQDVVSPEGIAGTLNTMSGGNREPKILVKEASKIGYTEGYEGDSVNFSQPNPKTRRGRVGKQRANTLETGLNQGVIENDLRIRKLTPLETWRLQGFTDEQFYKAQAVNSNSQLYKQAGNSVSVPVVYAVAKHLKINL